MPKARYRPFLDKDFFRSYNEASYDHGERRKGTGPATARQPDHQGAKSSPHGGDMRSEPTTWESRPLFFERLFASGNLHRLLIKANALFLSDILQQSPTSGIAEPLNTR